jgi:uncharacterized protein YfiM (DUF2279 family)
MPRLHAILLALALVLGCGTARANDSFASEFSHFVAGAAIASAATAVASHFELENRGWVGFWTSVGISFAEEAVQVASNGSSQLRGSAMDFGANLLGAAIGAWVTDKYVLQPMVKQDAAGHSSMGVALHMKF